ncbi:MAG: hypothetical protein M3235_10540 [Actinomycetota bacterium]|nr:hypothetical protein [Actinomycetota bacterium]
MARWAGTVIGMAALALGVAYLAFGWPVLVVGGPLFVGVVATLGVLLVTERPRRALRDRRDGRIGQSPWRTAAERGETPSAGLMSGFFEISPQVQVPPIGEYRIPAQAGASDEPAETPEPGSRRIRLLPRTARPARV